MFSTCTQHTPLLLLVQLFAVCFGTLGAVLIVRKAAYRLWVQYQQHKARQRIIKAELAREQRAREATASRRSAAAGVSSSVAGADVEAGSSSGGTVDEDGVRAPELCVVCLEEPSSTVYVNCGHMCCCYRCSLQLKRCPICRTRGDVIRVYKT